MENQPNVSNQVSNTIDVSKMTKVCSISNAFFHQFNTQRVRQLVDICQCQLYQHISIQGTEVPNYYLKIGSFVYSIQHNIFVLAKFENLVTFVFQNTTNQNSIYMLSFEVFNPEAQNFLQSLKQATQVIDYKSDSYEKTTIKTKIDQICDGQLTQQMIQNIQYVGPILKTLGSVMGAVSKNLVDPAAKAETIMHNGFNLLSEKMVSQQNKQRWNTVKDTASTWNEKITQIYKPIDNAFKLIASSISDNFNKSENKYVKTLKKFSLATAAALNNSYKKAQNQMMASKENQENLHEAHEVSTNNLTNS